MVVVTQPENVKRCCSKCKEMKSPDRIVKNRNICKDCCNNLYICYDFLQFYQDFSFLYISNNIV